MLIETIHELHESQFEILSIFDEFCKEHNIRYFLYGGTLLGSVRHENFIPWDDDLDIVMLRKDYEKFCTIPEKEHPEGFRTMFPLEKDIFFDFVPRFIDMGHNVKRIQYSEQDDIYPFLVNPGIDVLVLDKAYKGLRQKIRVLKQQFIYALARGHRPTVSKEIVLNSSSTMKHSGWIALVARMIQRIGKHLSLQREYDWYDSLSKKRIKDEGNLYISNDGPSLLNRVYKSVWFLDTAPVKIREKEFPAPIGYNDMLKEMYGNYMDLPPIELRIPEHFCLKIDISETEHDIIS